MAIVAEGTQIVGLIDDGDLSEEFSTELRRVIAAVKERAGPKGKANGSITLKLSIKAEGGIVTIDGDVAAKAPKPKRGASMFWALDDGRISTEHPQQMNMFPRDVSAREPVNA